jgi:hypothetical protein
MRGSLESGFAFSSSTCRKSIGLRLPEWIMARDIETLSCWRNGMATKAEQVEEHFAVKRYKVHSRA